MKTEAPWSQTRSDDGTTNHWYLEQARQAAAESYDVMNLSQWPPSWTDVAWTE
jgi:hypothetical protein